MGTTAARGDDDDRLTVRVTARRVPPLDGPPPVAAGIGGDPAARSHAAAGLGALLGLDPLAAGLAIGVDLVLSSLDLATVGLTIPVGVVAAAALAAAIYRVQVGRCGDARRIAVVKAVAVGILTAVPVPITPLFALPAGISGLRRDPPRRG